MTAATVFTSMALLNMLISPLNAFPWVLNGLTEAWVSIKRIQRLLDVSFVNQPVKPVTTSDTLHFQLPDLDRDQYYSSVLDYGSNFDLVVKDAAFTWGKSLSREERDRLHTVKRRRNKGKGKKVSTSENFAKQLENISEYKEEVGDYIFRLENINLFVKKVSDTSGLCERDMNYDAFLSSLQGAFVGVVGTVGCGKSSLLSGILAELTKESGSVAVDELERGNRQMFDKVMRFVI